MKFENTEVWGFEHAFRGLRKPKNSWNRSDSFYDGNCNNHYIIGERVANCILLFGLHYLDVFPVDTHIRKIIDREYDGELPDWAFGKYAGLFQQYIFYYELNHKE